MHALLLIAVLAPEPEAESRPVVDGGAAPGEVTGEGESSGGAAGEGESSDAEPGEGEGEGEASDAEPGAHQAPPEEVAPLEEVSAGPAAPSEEDGEVRTVRVSADPLGDGSDQDVFRYAAGRTTVDRAEIQTRGAASFSEALDKMPGVRSLEGIAGVGSTATKLNVGVRGADPRLSSKATVLLDGVPLAMAPYGQPELSLFPVSLFSIDRIDAVRGGVSVRFGPQTSGGVFNLMTKPIPRAPEASVTARVDQFGHAVMATGFGTTVDRLGVYVEYAPQAGRSFRDNSDVHVEAGLVKLAYEASPRVTLSSTSHLYWEDSGIPGGLSPQAYAEDRFGTTRPNDRFHGWRAGEAVAMSVRPAQGQELQLHGYYNHSDRSTVVANQPERTIRSLDRVYDSLGVEPRYALRLGRVEGRPYADLSVGVRGALELASLRRREVLASDPTIPWEQPSDADARLGALAAYVEQAHHLVDDRLVLRMGIRGELFRASRRNNNLTGPSAVLSQTFAGLVSSASLWLSPIDEVSTFVGYSRSLALPTFVQLQVATGASGTTVETVDTVESGVRFEDVVGLWGESTAWFRSMHNLRDIGIETVDIVANRAVAGGVETEVGWSPGDLWDGLVGSELYAGHAYTRSRILEGSGREGKELAWYPRHEAWAGVAYSFPWPCSFLPGVEGSDDCRALQVGTDVEWSDTQFSDYNDTVEQSATGHVGLIPSYTLWDAYARFEMLLPRYWAFNLTVGVKNILDAEWFYRTDDINLGILPQRPRTVYVTLDVKHWFFDAQQRAQGRRDRRRARRRGGES